MYQPTNSPSITNGYFVTYPIPHKYQFRNNLRLMIFI